MANHANLYIIPVTLTVGVVNVPDQLVFTRIHIPEPLNITNSTGGQTETKGVF